MNQKPILPRIQVHRDSLPVIRPEREGHRERMQRDLQSLHLLESLCLPREHTQEEEKRCRCC